MSEPVVVALDVGGTGMKCALVRPDGTVHHSERHSTLAERGPAAVTGHILDVAAGLADRARADGLDPIAAGIAVPGVVDEVNGVAVWSSNVGFRDVPLRDLLTAKLGLPAALGHDVRVGGIAEARLGAGRGQRHVLFVAIGTGIAAAFVLDGVGYAGAHGAAGEVGYLPFEAEQVELAKPTEPGVVGAGVAGAVGASPTRLAERRGMLEGAVGADAVVATAVALGMPRTDNPDGEAALGAKDVFDAARAGDGIALAAVRMEAGRLAHAIAAVAAVLDPALIVLGGGIGGNADLLLDPVREALAELTPLRPELAASTLGRDAVLMGAIATALKTARDYVFESRSSEQG